MSLICSLLGDSAIESLQASKLAKKAWASNDDVWSHNTPCIRVKVSSEHDRESVRRGYGCNLLLLATLKRLTTNITVSCLKVYCMAAQILYFSDRVSFMY